MFQSALTIGNAPHIEKVTIGGGAPVAIQTMWKEPLTDIGAALSRIEKLRSLGCRILRFAVPAASDAEVLGRLAERCPMPLVADIHFDYRIALACLDYPIAKLRINPGNIGGEERVRAVLLKARDKNVPLRIGVNAGSLPPDLRDTPMPIEDALLEAAERELAIFYKYNFYNVVVSLKASSAKDTISAARKFRAKYKLPLHIGVTEAGPLIAGVVRNTYAVAKLLEEGIGETVRVSLSSTMENEVITCREILGLFADNNRGVEIISCPRCARASFDTHGFVNRWQEKLYSANINAKIAVMGCVVNGPGEARHADFGITGAAGKAVLFKKGEKARTVNIEEADAAFLELLGLDE